MQTEIINDGASLKLKTGTQERNIIKHYICEITVVKDNIIKIDCNRGALANVYIPFADVVAPATDSPLALKDAINAMLSTAASTGLATEAEQQKTNHQLEQLSELMNTVKNSLNAIDNKVFFEPLLIDESQPHILYKGFAHPAAKMEDAVWAIQKITVADGISTYQWANGTKDFAAVWNNRAALSYS